MIVFIFSLNGDGSSGETKVGPSGLHLPNGSVLGAEVGDLETKKKYRKSENQNVVDCGTFAIPTNSPVSTTPGVCSRRE